MTPEEWNMLRKRGLYLAALAVAPLFALGQSAKAAVTPFTYTTTITPSVANSTPGGNASVDFFGITSTTNGTSPDAPASADYSAGTLQLVNNTPGTPFAGESFNVPYTIAVTITANGFTKTLNLSAVLTGTIDSPPGATSTTASTFSTVPGPVSDTFGNAVLTITGISGKYFGAPGSPSASTNTPGGPGSLTFTIGTSAVPEPTSVILMGLGGIGALGLFRRRKARKAD